MSATADEVDDPPDAYHGRPAWRAQWFELALAVILAALLVVGLALMNSPEIATALALLLTGLAGFLLYEHYSWRYTIDRENIESHRGIIGRDLRSIRTRDLRNVNVRQSFWQRLLGIGHVEFSSSAGADVEVAFYSVRDPMGVKRIAQRLQGQ